MIVGNGLVAGALIDRPGVLFHAAGVADSTCTDEAKFARDERRLRESLERPETIVYFGTCSPEKTPYAQHKMRMEALCLLRGNALICRLPILGGLTDNPHTLLNVIRRRIVAGEQIDVWTRARRYVVDVADVGLAVDSLVGRTGVVTIAPPWDYTVPDIVQAMARGLKRKVTVNEIEKGEPMRIKPELMDIRWQGLESIVRRYYA